MESEETNNLSAYERAALVEVHLHRERQLSRAPMKLVPDRVRETVSERGHDLQDRIRSSARGAAAIDSARAKYATAMSGAGRALSKIANATTSPSRVQRAFTKRGHPTGDLVDIRKLDLEEVDRVRPRLMNLAYASAAMVEGAVTGATISGGEALALFGSVSGAGAGGAPGFGTVAGAMAGDAAFVLAAGSRAVAHTALYYGYDPAEPGEQLFIMSVLNLGTATTSGAKYFAYQELSQLTQKLARRATWNSLNEHVLSLVAQKFAARMGFRLTQKKLGQIVPIAGIVVGAGMNYKLLDEICDAAHWAYRERFLTEKLSVAGGFVLPEFSVTVTDSAGESETELNLVKLFDEPEVEINLLELVEEAEVVDEAEHHDD